MSCTWHILYCNSTSGNKLDHFKCSLACPYSVCNIHFNQSADRSVCTPKRIVLSLKDANSKLFERHNSTTIYSSYIKQWSLYFRHVGNMKDVHTAGVSSYY